MNKWIIRPKVNNHARLRLFCFPYAGSSAVVTYKFLVDSLSEDIEVCPIEFPGRGARMAEPLIYDIEEVMAELSYLIKDFSDLPYAFLGHSMGALVSYELAQHLSSNFKVSPQKLYLSAHNAPQLPREGKIMHKLKRDQFLDELKNMNGIADELLDHEELLQLVLPIIQNDYKLCETYKYIEKGKVNIPIHVFGGDADKDVTPEKLEAWNELTDKEFDLEILPGDHFFILKNRDSFARRMQRHLKNDISKLA